MKDLDAERTARVFSDSDREFKLGGEVFRVRASTNPNDLTEFWDTSPRDVTNARYLEIEDATIKALIEPDQADLWDRVRLTADPPVNARDIAEALNYAMEVQAGRPTEPSPPSPNGHATETSSTSLKDASSSPAEPASTA